MRDPNLAAVELVVAALGELADELVLVGGCAVGLLVTDPARTPVRQTIDVDLLTEVTPTSSYHALGDRLRARGFMEQMTEDVICRWAKGSLLIDVMPTDGAVLGFTNSWYGHAARTATKHLLPSGSVIRLICAPLFIATKLEAFASRGHGDYTHHDMEDIVTVLDGRDTLVDEVRLSSPEVKGYLGRAFEALLSNARFIDQLAWLLPPNELVARRRVVTTRMRTISGLVA